MQVGSSTQSTGWLVLNRARPLNVAIRTRDTGFADPAVATAASATVDTNGLRTQVREAWAALGSALRGVSNETRTAVTTLHFQAPSIAARVRGRSALVEPIVGQRSTLHATVRVSTRASATPAPIDIDASTAASRLSSALLGLDITSPAAASVLRSSAALGLDLTSPDALSVLRSAAALGLDLTSPEAVSRLVSSALGLDLTSPDAPSRLTSSANLGLDVTSPTAASVLRSSTGLGLDLTTPGASSTVRSSAPLGLDTSTPEASSTITSYAAINTATTSYAPSLSFSSGTSVGTLSGTYAGTGSAASATNLTVKTLTSTTLSTSTAQSVRIQVANQSGTTLVDTTVSLKAGERIYLGDDIGLYLSLSAGTVVSNATASSAVSTSTATDVDGNATFNATDANLRPRFEKGVQVAAGAFTINGTSITVNADDSINAVLARINASAAGVTASLSGDRITLTTDDPSEDDIVLGDDTSGFLSATKLIAADEEINSASKSYAKVSMAFGGLSTSSVQLSGEYLGVGAYASATSLSINMIGLGGSISASTANSVRFQVVNQSGTVLDDITASVRAGDKIAVGSQSGLWVSFTAGSYVLGASVSTAVSSSKTDVDASAAFNAADVNNRPRFEGNAQVTAGSFKVNGTSVTVNANDTINAVLSRINSTVSGVTASISNDRISIVDTNGDRAVLTSDTSGFLAATKLTAPATTKGIVRDDEQAFAKTTQLSSVVDGTFEIDGHTITVDAGTDSLQSIIAKINASGARVTASYDDVTDEVVLTTTIDSEDDVAIGSDTSGFLAAVGVDATNSTHGVVRDDLQVLAKTSQFGGVTSGSFTVNGVAIAVDHDADSLATIISRINSAGAGVTAALDTATNKVVLTADHDTEDLIAVSGDTTGFLDAAGLASSNTERGNIQDDQQVLAKTSQFATVSTGSFTINGTLIALDRDVDTLATVLDRINNAGAGVIAGYDAVQDRIELVSTTDGMGLITVAGDTTGFLTAASLATGDTVRGHLAEDTVAIGDLDRFASVTGGSFVVDGHTITVSTTDSVQDIVARINASGARVVAAYDTDLDALTFETTFDSEADVPIGADTSGFLAAAGVDSTSSTHGNVRDDEQVLGATTQFGTVTTGSFTINGTSITIDADTDTLTTVLARINAAGAGVTATYDAVDDKVVLTATTAGESPVSVEDDTTGFLAAAGLATEATEIGNVRDDQQVLSRTTQFASVVSGSFTVNGQTVTVDVDTDTLESIVARINAAGAGVTALIDAGADEIRLTTDGDSEADIVVGDDSSGLLAAMHLDDATTVRGNIVDDAQAIGTLAQFSGVTSGSFSLFGETITVDVDTDTIGSLIQRINDAALGVVASYDGVTDRLVLVTDHPSDADIDLGSDDTGFLVAAGLDPSSTTRGRLGDDQMTLSSLDAFAGVTAGSFTINDQVVAVDPDSDSIATVIDRINDAGAGVTASFDRNSAAIVLTADDGVSPILLTDDTSGFTSAAALTASVDTSRSFDADPTLFDPTVPVGAGTFSVNGVTITVAADDSIDSVLSKIGASGAGVTATFDTATQTVRLRADADDDAPITVGDDTSGFLAAVKLDGTATSVTGNKAITSLDTALGDLDAYADVQAGTVTIDGHDIAIDPTTMTIRDVVTALSTIPGVVASFDEVSGELEIAAQGDADLTVADTSGLLDALGISTGTVHVTPGARTTSLRHTQITVSNASDVADRVVTAIDDLNRAMAQLDMAPHLRAQFRWTLEDALTRIAGAGVGGLSLQGTGTMGAYVAVDRGALLRSLGRVGDDPDAPARFSTVGEQLARLTDAVVNGPTVLTRTSAYG